MNEKLLYAGAGSLQFLLTLRLQVGLPREAFNQLLNDHIRADAIRFGFETAHDAMSKRSRGEYR